MSLALPLLYLSLVSNIKYSEFFCFFFSFSFGQHIPSVLKLEIWLQPHLSHQNFFFSYTSCHHASWNPYDHPTWLTQKPPRWSPHLIFFPLNNHHQKNGSRSGQSAGHVTTTLRNPQWFPSANWLRKARPLSEVLCAFHSKLSSWSHLPPNILVNSTIYRPQDFLPAPHLRSSMNSEVQLRY